MKCPNCNTEGKEVKNHPSWYSCTNPSCNRNVWDSSESNEARARKITITCDDNHDEFTSVERDMIEEWLGEALGLVNIKIEQEEAV